MFAWEPTPKPPECGPGCSAATALAAHGAGFCHCAASPINPHLPRGASALCSAVPTGNL